MIHILTRLVLRANCCIPAPHVALSVAYRGVTRRPPRKGRCSPDSDRVMLPGGTGGGSTAVSRFAFSVGTVLLRDVSGFSRPTPPFAVAFGMTPERRISETSQRREKRPQVPRTTQCICQRHQSHKHELIRIQNSKHPFKHPCVARKLHATVMAVAEVPCDSPRFPWSTIAVCAAEPT
jgi:hypothetical protein